jgi:hypothetical protein
MPDIHFVVGVWRSGTTMLREILDMSSEVKTLPEHFILLNHLSKSSNFNESNRQEMLQSILTNQDFLHFAKPNLKQLKVSFSSSTDFESAIKIAYESCLAVDQKPSVIIDKNPIYSYYLPELLSLFPRAKFVWMVREPKDNCISRAKHKIQHFGNYNYLASWWNKTNYLIAKEAKINPGRFHLVNYDAICESPKEYTEQICDFLGIGYNDEMLNFRKNKEEKLRNYLASLEARDGKINAAYLKKKYDMWENLQKPVNTSKKNQWKNELSAKQIQSVDGLTKEFYQHLLKGDFSVAPINSKVWDTLVNISLGKLKADIKKNRKH